LSLINGVVYIAWSSHCDLGPYHGWIIGYDSTNLTRAVVYNDTPNGSAGGLWMSDDSLAADTNGNIYLSTGNGTVDPSGGPNRGESFLKLVRSGGSLTVASWFTPYNFQNLEMVILTSVPAISPDSGTSLAFSGGKQGVCYLVNRDNMGGLTPVSVGSDTNVIQHFSVTSDQVHGGMVWWDGGTNSFGYIWPASTFLQQYKFDRTTTNSSCPLLRKADGGAGGQPGGILAVSANGTNAGSGILWAVHQLNGDANHSILPGILHAYDAQNVTRNCGIPSNSVRATAWVICEIVPPTVANGKVYLATFSGQIDVYGPGRRLGGSAAIHAQRRHVFRFGNSHTFRRHTRSEYLLHNGWKRAHDQLDSLYRLIRFDQHHRCQSQAVKAGFVDSPLTATTFLNSSAIGTGTGLVGAYYSNQAKTFNNPATLTRTDATVNFNWGTGSPAAGISVDTFTVRWTGAVQPPISDTYTFYATTDDGVRLWINNQLVIDNWVDQAPTDAAAQS